MKKILIFFLAFFLYANDFEMALKYEKIGDYEKAMQIYKELALRNFNLANSKENLNLNLQNLEKNLEKSSQNSAKLNLENSQQNSQQNSSNLNSQNLTKTSQQNSANSNSQISQKNSNNFDLDTYLNAESFGISAHKMNYFLPFSHSFNKLENNNKNEAKFQISVKKLLFSDLLGFDERVYFAYTQTSWWQIYENSAPFRENNYQPEIFVDLPLKFDKINNLRFGFLHESNGQGEADLKSRSWNRLYLSTIFRHNNFLINPRVFVRIPEPRSDDDNPDIRHYMGNFDVNLAYLGEKFFLNTMLRNNLNLNKNKGALQLDFGYDLFNNGIFYYVQFFSGYGESLIDYNKKINRLGVGVLIAY